jgi:hypothetical protein
MLAAMKATEGATEGSVPQRAPSIAEVAAAFPQLEILQLIGQGGWDAFSRLGSPG